MVEPNPLLGLFVRLQDIRVLVVGGGAVGRRKARQLLACGAWVRLVAREAQPPETLHPRLEWLQQEYHSDHLDQVRLVVAAAHPEIHSKIHADAALAGIWVCDASTPELGAITFPAVRQCGPIFVAVSTNGFAPGAAREISDMLAEQLDHATVLWVNLLARIREKILTVLPNDHSRANLLRLLSDRRWIEQIRQKGEDATWKEWEEILATGQNFGSS